MPEKFYRGSWVAPSPTNYARENWRTTEKMSSGPRGVKIPEFLPFYLDQTVETSTIRLYYRRMLADPVVKAALVGKLLAVAAQELQIHPVDKNNPFDQEVAEFCSWVLTERMCGGFMELVWNVFIGMLVDGFSVVEPIWRVEKDSSKYKNCWVVAETKAKDVDNDLVLDIDEFNNVVGLRGLRFNAGETFDPRDFIIARHMPLYNNPAGMSDLRAVYSRYWVLDTAWKLRAVGLERRSMPILFGTYATASQKPSLEAALAAARYNNWISAPAGAQVEVKDIAGRSQDEFRNAIQDLREEIFLGIQGATLQALTGQEGQQRGNSKVHETTANLLKWALSKQICNILNDHENGLLRRLVRLNYGFVEIPRATLDAVDDAELSQSLAVDQGLHNLGLSLSKEQLREKYGRLAPKTQDDELPGVPPPPAPGAMPGGPGGAPGAEPGMDMGAMAGEPGQEMAPQEGEIPADEMPAQDQPGTEVPQEAAAMEQGQPGELMQAQEIKQIGASNPDDARSVRERVPVAGRSSGARSSGKRFMDQNLFSGRMKRFDEDLNGHDLLGLVARWNSKEPSPAEMEAVGRKLQRSGWALYHDGQHWQAGPARKLPQLMGGA